ncbi:hypothetical protein D6201_03030 [Aurantiacibacter aquimixticola]|uniref:Uncharacterized protein n=2 Tax=Aurantiacibacter aquimixticola TaxID=1958945 RepID=A0A419RRS2_9SPHN|nr:hypothetical protein D6201_03030 [Aurantiacibacter aquimixticola]
MLNAQRVGAVLFASIPGAILVVAALILNDPSLRAADWGMTLVLGLIALPSSFALVVISLALPVWLFGLLRAFLADALKSTTLADIVATAAIATGVSVTVSHIQGAVFEHVVASVCAFVLSAALYVRKASRV